jgi:uncharacterized phage-associated protein
MVQSNTIPTSGLAASNWVLECAWKHGFEVSNLKLQKLLYLTHAFCLVELKHPLVNREFEAWRRGPVLRESYEAFRHYGRSPIDSIGTYVDPITGHNTTVESAPPSEVVKLMDRIIGFYGKWSAGHLVELTHANRTPWKAIVSESDEKINVGLRIPDRLIVERFRYHWFGADLSAEPLDVAEDSPFTDH